MPAGKPPPPGTPAREGGAWSWQVLSSSAGPGTWNCCPKSRPWRGGESRTPTLHDGHTCYDGEDRRRPSAVGADRLAETNTWLGPFQAFSNMKLEQVAYTKNRNSGREGGFFSKVLELLPSFRQAETPPPLPRWRSGGGAWMHKLKSLTQMSRGTRQVEDLGYRHCPSSMTLHVKPYSDILPHATRPPRCPVTVSMR
ncbi:hypothetical protein LZ30DRAFT_730907 [Colletotrichum cereale]|nr:hypothetical protein LZ30DRAFT_730907 [Colletotrichum cereale]